MRILVCNDDGAQAPGLRLLAQAAQSMTPDVWVVAPERKWTAASHHVTFDRDVTLAQDGKRRYRCSGTPVDGVIAAMSILLADRKPDLVLAGINDKRNVGEDLAYSGTMAIAREATFWGVPAIALSGEGWGTRGDAEPATLVPLLRLLWERHGDWAGEGCWLAVNLPASLPAPLAQPRIGRDKIAGGCDVVDSSPGRIVYRTRRGRPGTLLPGDENSALAAGHVGIVRHRWFADAQLPDEVLARWGERLGS
jgi:5'-nucleotidase